MGFDEALANVELDIKLLSMFVFSIPLESESAYFRLCPFKCKQ